MATEGGIVTGKFNQGLGLYQFIKGRKMEKELGDRPEYEIPQEIEANLSMAQRQALEGMPAEQKSQYVDNLMQMQGAGLSQLSDRKAGLVGAGQIAQAGTQGYRDLLSMDAQARRENQQILMQQNETMAALTAQTAEMQIMLRKQNEIRETELRSQKEKETKRKKNKL